MGKGYRWTRIGFSSLSLVVLLTGCAAIRGATARRNHIEDATRGHVYNRPVDQVWGPARQLLFEHGFTVRDTGEGGTHQAETEWKQEDRDRRVRYLVSGMPASDDRAQVQFTRSEEQHEKSGGWSPLDTERDLDLEFELIKRVEPEQASHIETDADQAKEKAKAEG
jgi:hypothetical protein